MNGKILRTLYFLLLKHKAFAIQVEDTIMVSWMNNQHVFRKDYTVGDGKRIVHGV